MSLVRFLARSHNPLQISLSKSILPRSFRACVRCISTSRLERLENNANQNPNDASKQAEYLRELVNTDPNEVIIRYESQQFAANDDVKVQYLKALGSVGRIDYNKMFNTATDANSAYQTPAYSGGYSQPPQQQYQYQQQQQQQPASYGYTAQPFSRPIQPAAAATAAPYNPFRQGEQTTQGAVGTWNNPAVVVTKDAMTGRGMLAGLLGKFLMLALFLGAATYVIEVMSRGSGRGEGFGFGMVQEVKPIQNTNTKFTDVKGCDEAKAELEEIVEYLKDPAKFTRLGGKLPKGVLLTGPPGTGKTLLAKAIAGEAGVPFYFAAGSEFEEMFVGVGARRVRELFAAAKKNSPCIIFIDEIDAVGGARSSRDQSWSRMTLNQLLSELDGFVSVEGIIVIAATNFPESLDKALVRPGRFDKQVVVPQPDLKGRIEILDHYLSKVPVAPEVNVRLIAQGTVGFCGADLKNLVNIAAVRASMLNKNDINTHDLDFAKDKIIMGSERKSALRQPENIKLTAYHEGGHALVALLTEGAHPVHKATIIPRGNALGMVTQIPEGDIEGYTREQLLAKLDVCMGGRVAEEIIFGAEKVTTGASSDIKQATEIARVMVTQYGMSSLGPVDWRDNENKISPEMKQRIDAEVKLLVESAYERAKSKLYTHEKDLHRIAEALLKHETLSGQEIRDLLAGKPIRENSDDIKF